MYCPRCAADNVDSARFCRACGTDLEPVALALAGEVAPPAQGAALDAKARTEWLQQRGRGASGVTTGAVLLSISLLMAVALSLMPATEVPWPFLWIAFFGWMAIWGGISLAQGIGMLFEARAVLGEAAPTTRRLTPRTAPGLQSGGVVLAAEAPPSVTEQTTRRLDSDGPDA
jgi:hypothetical protein